MGSLERFTIDFIASDSLCYDMDNVHTHGLWEAHKHLDLQLCLGVGKDAQVVILRRLAMMVQSGKRFAPDIKYPDIIEGHCVRFEFAYDCDRLVLRAVICDETCKLSGIMKDQDIGTFKLPAICRRIIKKVIDGAKSKEQLAIRYDATHYLGQLMLVGVLEVIHGTEVLFALTEHGRRAYEHLSEMAILGT